jgi:hypothetical protein
VYPTGQTRYYLLLIKFSTVFHNPLPKQFTAIHIASLKKNLKKVLTPYIHPNITSAYESRGGNYEKDRDAFARPVFGRLFRLALRGGGL